MCCYVCKNQDSKAEQGYERGFSESVDFLSVKLLKLGAKIKCFPNRKKRLRHTNLWLTRLSWVVLFCNLSCSYNQIAWGWNPLKDQLGWMPKMVSSLIFRDWDGINLSLSPSPPTMQLAWASLQYRSLREVRLPTWWLAFSSVSSDQSRNCNTLCDAALVLFLKHPEAFYWSKVSHRASPDSSGGAILRDYCILHKNFLL